MKRLTKKTKSTKRWIESSTSSQHTYHKGYIGHRGPTILEVEDDSGLYPPMDGMEPIVHRTPPEGLQVRCHAVPIGIPSPTRTSGVQDSLTEGVTPIATLTTRYVPTHINASSSIDE